MRIAVRMSLALLLAGLAGAASSQQQPAWLRMAIAGERADPEALRKAADPGNEEQQKLIAAYELAWLRRDAEAAVALRTAANTMKSVPLRVDALNMLTAVHLRAGDYALAAAARSESRKLIPPSGPAELDLLATAEALKDTPPMTLSGNPRGALLLKLEKDGIPRAKVAINGQDEWAILDTGASFSAVSRSMAQKAGIRSLGASARFSASGNREANAGLGVADELVIAQTTFRNVVVLILPDEDMDIFGSATKASVIVGLPVFVKMGSIAMLPEKNDALIFIFLPSGGQPGAASNIRMHKLTPIVTGTLKNPDPAPISMHLDTGANATTFNARFMASFPELMADTPAVSTTSAAIGNASLSRQARKLREFRIDIGGTGVTLDGAHAYEEKRPAYDGALGQDALRKGFIADFDEMIFELAPRSKAPR
jgi:hypothetical protein